MRAAAESAAGAAAETAKGTEAPTARLGVDKRLEEVPAACGAARVGSEERTGVVKDPDPSAAPGKESGATPTGANPMP
ncbi:MAG: hypothetical protein AAB576_08620 [Elusimicrobiota bacterium]